ncbi:MAG: PKD domain-containing protein, partial [Flavobacteriales bacterium]|nr:PKD domain-containing protein [Flavobacteriales bacterium]
MKKLYSYILLLIIVSFFSVDVKAHAVQVGYCTNCQGDLRIWIEHWHGPSSGLTSSLPVPLTISGVPTTIIGQSVLPTAGTAANLPGCINPFVSFGSCPARANNENNWVAYDFPSVPCGVPITLTVTDNPNTSIFTDDCGGMYPATSGVITLPCVGVPPPDVVVCGGAPNTVGPFNFAAGTQWTNSNTAIGLPANGTGDISFTPANVTTSQTGTITVLDICNLTSNYTITVDPSPIANFTGNGVGIGAAPVCPGQPVTFNNTSTGSPTSWLWDFGDGSATSTQQNPTHTFPLVGSPFNVTLTAIGTGCSSNIIIPINFGGPTSNFSAPSVCS